MAQEEDISDSKSSSGSKKDEQQKVPRRGVVERLIRLEAEQKQNDSQDSATHSILRKNLDNVPKELTDGTGLISGHGNRPRSNLEGENLLRADHHDVPAFHKSKQLDDRRPTITGREACRSLHHEETLQRTMEEQRLRNVEDRKKKELKAANTMANMWIGPPPKHIPRCINGGVVGNGGDRDTIPRIPANLSSTDVNVRPTPSNPLYDEGRMITGRRLWQRWLRSGDRGSSSHQAQVNLPNMPGLNLPGVPQSLQQSSSSMENSASRISPSFSMRSSQMKPPLNQSFHGNNNTPLSSETDKMVGMKRPCPFSRESSPVPPFHRNVPTYAASRFRPDELVSRSIGDAASIEARKRHIRGHSNPNISSEPKHDPREVDKDDRRLMGSLFRGHSNPNTSSEPKHDPREVDKDDRRLMGSFFRGHSNPNTSSEPKHDPMEVDKDDRRLMGSFSTLAPPVADSSLGNGNGNGDIAGDEIEANLRSLSNFLHINFSRKGSSNSNASSESEHDLREVDRYDPGLLRSFSTLTPPVADSSLSNDNGDDEESEDIDLNLKL